MDLKLVKVDSIDHLREICKDGEPKDFVLMLNLGCRSSKVVAYWKGEERPWYVFNLIDDSEEELTEEELRMNTNIGSGIERGAFYHEVYA